MQHPRLKDSSHTGLSSTRVRRAPRVRARRPTSARRSRRSVRRTTGPSAVARFAPLAARSVVPTTTLHVRVTAPPHAALPHCLQVCCGQPGTLDSEGVTCPRRAPTCVGYIDSAAWGQCIDTRTDAPPETAWGRKAVALAATSGWRERTPRATLVAMHARSERDSFFPMEVAATAAEVAEVRTWGRPLLVWPEDRRRPIRMTHTLPLPWIVAGAAPHNASRLVGEALRGEFYAFQLGAYAAERSLILTSAWTELRGVHHGGVIGVGRLRCTNQPAGSSEAAALEPPVAHHNTGPSHRHTCHASTTKPSQHFSLLACPAPPLPVRAAAALEGLALPVGEVLPFWFGLDVPTGATPDTYRGTVTIHELGAPSASPRAAERVSVEISISSELAVEAGDRELWRHSRWARPSAHWPCGVGRSLRRCDGRLLRTRRSPPSTNRPLTTRHAPFILRRSHRTRATWTAKAPLARLDGRRRDRQRDRTGGGVHAT